MTKKTDEIVLEALGVCLKLETDHTDFLRFLNSYVAVLAGKNGKTSPDISIRLLRNSSQQREGDCTRISRDLRVRGRTVILNGLGRAHNLNFHVTVEDSKLHIDAFLGAEEAHRSLRSLVMRSVNQKGRILRYVMLTYYLVYLPLFYYLEHFRNLSFLPASAIRYKQDGIVFAGLGGVGKTTFALQCMSMLDECRILSDGISFYDRERIFGMPGPIALDSHSVRLLRACQSSLDPIIDVPTHHGRKYYAMGQDFFVSSAVPRYIFWLQAGNQNSISPLDTSSFAYQLPRMNLLTDHLREYFVFSATIDLMLKGALIKESVHDKLSVLLSNTSCYTLTYDPHSDFRTVFDKTVIRVLTKAI